MGGLARQCACLSGLLAAIRDYHLTPLDKFILVVVIGLGAWCGWVFLDDLQCGLARVRRALDPSDYEASSRGLNIVKLHKTILVGSAAFIVWIVLWKLR
jgi:hypothetical protein